MSFLWVELGEICDLKNGYAFKSKDYVESSNTLSCRMSNVRPGGIFDINYNARFLPDDFAEKHSDFLLADNDVVIAMTDLADSPKILGVPTVVKTNGKNILLNQRVGKLVIKDRNKVYVPYLKLALNYPKIRVVYKKFAGGGLQINLGKADLLSVKIPLPPLKEQKRIAAILDKADAIRRKRQQAIDLTDQLLRSVFLDMFGDPVTNPKGWAVQTLDSACVDKAGVKAGPFGSALKKEFYTESGYRIYGQEQVIAGTLSIGDYYINESKYLKLESCSIMSGDMLISLVGSIGKTLVVPEEFEPGIINPRLVRIRPNKDLLQSEYLQQLFKQPRFQMQLSSYSHGGTMPILNAGILKDLNIQMPPLELQSQFISILNKIEIKMKDFITAQRFNENLFCSLTQKAFNGELSKQSKAA